MTAPSEVHARRNEKPSDERYRDNGALIFICSKRFLSWMVDYG